MMIVVELLLIFVSHGRLSIFKTGNNPNLYALCDAYYDADKIDISCGALFPSTSPSISLVPSTSSAPTITPDCSCGVGEFKFELELKTDIIPWETSWRIEDENGDILHSEFGYKFNDVFTTFNYEYCLPVGCYDFVIDDSWGDGICCNGYYKASIYGWKEVFNGDEFGRQAIEHFCGEDVCPFATHYPSLVPTSSSAPTTTPSTSQIISISNTPFYFNANEKTWDDCKSHAENYHFDFASIQNQEENDAVANYLQSNDIQRVWLGGYQTSDEDWAWLDGTSWSDSTYTNWWWNQPDNRNNEHHLALRSWDGSWWDGNKEWKYPCIFRDIPSSSAPTADSLLASTVLAFFESIVTFFNNLLPF